MRLPALTRLPYCALVRGMLPFTRYSYSAHLIGMRACTTPHHAHYRAPPPTLRCGRHRYTFYGASVYAAFTARTCVYRLPAYHYRLPRAFFQPRTARTTASRYSVPQRLPAAFACRRFTRRTRWLYTFALRLPHMRVRTAPR